MTSGHDLTGPHIAQATGLGKSTVGKALNRLAAAGQATRTPGDRSGTTRTPDRWNLVPDSPTDARTGTGTGTDAGTEAGTDASTGPATTAAPTGRIGAPRATTAPLTGSTKRSPSTRSTGAAPRAVSVPTDAAASAPSAAPAPVAAPAQKAARVGAATDPETTGAARNPVTGTVKLAPGALTPLVAGHFAANPGTALTAGEVGRALGRSGGAVRNTCDKLVRDGDLRIVSDTPRRYTLSAAS